MLWLKVSGARLGGGRTYVPDRKSNIILRVFHQLHGAVLDGYTGSIHERVREAHFGSIDGAISGGLDDSEQVVIFRVEDDALGSGLRRKTINTLTPSPQYCGGG